MNANASSHHTEAPLSIQPTHEVLDHEYDGIREYDNPTPGWWHLLFLATVAFSIPYFLYYETNGDVPTSNQEYGREKTVRSAEMFAALGTLKPDEQTVLRMAGEERWMGVAASVYQVNCQQCHGAKGQGLVGPNMTDEHYKNIKAPADFIRVISEGAAGGAMPPWKDKLSENHIILLSAYMSALRGKNLPSTRPAEGDVIAPWPKVQPAK